MYSTFDDGVEFFGGAVNVTNLVALYVRDDSIDFSDGYVGTVQNALVIHSLNNGNRCIEGDNIGELRSIGGEPLDTPPLTNPTIRNLTCITSNFDAGTHGDSEGPLLRQGAQMQLIDSIVYGGYGTSVSSLSSNECIEIESPVSLASAAAGNSTMTTTIVACQEAIKGTLANGDALTEWAAGANPSTNGANYSFNAGNTIITDPTNANVTLLAPNSYYTATALTDAAGAAITHPTAATGGHFGAVLAADDWTTSWTFGIHATNRAQPLWFE